MFFSVRVNNVPFEMDRSEIATLFSRYGPLRPSRTKDDHNPLMMYIDGQHKGYAFIDFARPEDAAKVIGEKIEIWCHGRLLKIGRHDTMEPHLMYENE